MISNISLQPDGDYYLSSYAEQGGGGIRQGHPGETHYGNGSRPWRHSDWLIWSVNLSHSSVTEENMGYDLHITRTDDWIDSMESPITSDQWLSLVADDPELTLAPEYGSNFVLWPRSSETDTPPWFDLIDGQIMAKNPDEAMIIKMIEIAGKLKAKVQGDDREVYTLTTNGLKWQQADEIATARPMQQKWWQRWFRRP